MVATLFWISLFYVIYTYIGYPLVIALVAFFRPKSVYKENYFPIVTVLIAAYNEEKVISKKADS